MFLLTREEQIQVRILIIIVISCGILHLFFSDPNKISIKEIAIKGENQLEIKIDSNNDIEVGNVSQTRKTSSNRVIINTSSYEDLLNCPNIGPKKATQIIEERKKAVFYDWRDFQDRIKGISYSQIENLKDYGVKLNASDSDTL